MTEHRITTARRTPENVVRENDYVTMAQCVKIAAGIADQMMKSDQTMHAEGLKIRQEVEQMIAAAEAEQDRRRHQNRWDRRVLRWLRTRRA